MVVGRRGRCHRRRHPVLNGAVTRRYGRERVATSGRSTGEEHGKSKHQEGGGGGLWVLLIELNSHCGSRRVQGGVHGCRLSRSFALCMVAPLQCRLYVAEISREIPCRSSSPRPRCSLLSMSKIHLFLIASSTVSSSAGTGSQLPQVFD